MINKITKTECPDIWSDIISDYDDLGEMEHRRGSTFYVAPQYVIDPKYFPDHPELHGRWESDTVTWSDDWGLDDSEPDTLYRIELVEKVVTTKEWVRV